MAAFLSPMQVCRVMEACRIGNSEVKVLLYYLLLFHTVLLFSLSIEDSLTSPQTERVKCCMKSTDKLTLYMHALEIILLKHLYHSMWCRVQASGRHDCQILSWEHLPTLCFCWGGNCILEADKGRSCITSYWQIEACLHACSQICATKVLSALQVLPERPSNRFIVWGRMLNVLITHQSKYPRRKASPKTSYKDLKDPHSCMLNKEK